MLYEDLVAGERGPAPPVAYAFRNHTDGGLVFRKVYASYMPHTYATNRESYRVYMFVSRRRVRVADCSTPIAAITVTMGIFTVIRQVRWTPVEHMRTRPPLDRTVRLYWRGSPTEHLRPPLPTRWENPTLLPWRSMRVEKSFGGGRYERTALTLGHRYRSKCEIDARLRRPRPRHGRHDA